MVDTGGFLQSQIDYLTQPAPPDGRYALDIYVAGNHPSSANQFVFYAVAFAVQYESAGVIERHFFPAALSGDSTLYYSDRTVNPDHSQPFDKDQTDQLLFAVTVPTGQLTMSRPDNGALVSRYHSVTCTDDGLMVAASDFDGSMIIASFSRRLIPVIS